MDRTGTVVRSLDHRELQEIGRRARLELRFGVRRGRTVLVHAYAEPPFRVGQTFAEGPGLHLILASSAPGIFGGDALMQQIDVEPGARVRLTSQSALQVHASPDGEVAGLVSRYTVGADASLACEWEPVIPFASSALRQRLSVDLDRGATLFWSDALMAGREARGERWLFERMDHELAVRRAGELVYLERYLLAPSKVSLNRRWLAGDAAYFGSIVLVGEVERDPAAVHTELARYADVEGAADRLERDVLLVRTMASSGSAFHSARAALRRQLWT